MVIGGIPLLALSALNHDPAFEGSFTELTTGDYVALFYTSLFGSAVSYGVYFYNATKGYFEFLTFLKYTLSLNSTLIFVFFSARLYWFSCT
jgi:drug/metabolite transporter (DMT)-like permease